MAEHIDHQTSQLMRIIHNFVVVSRTLILAGAIGLYSGLSAQAQECTTTKECAQQMVNLANELKAENVALNQRIQDLEIALAKQSAAATAALNARFKKLRAGGANIPAATGGNGKSKYCPKGQYMVGNLWQIDSGNSAGVISWIAPVCRKFP